MDNMEISLIDIIKILKSNIIFIVIFTFLCTGVMAAKLIYFTEPVYQAVTTVVIVKGDNSPKNAQYYTQDDIALYEKMATTYSKIAQSNLVINKTAEELKTYSPLQLKQMVKAIPSANTQIIELSAVSNNKNDVASIANTYCKNFINESTSILPVGKIEILDQAVTPSSPISPRKLLNLAIAFFVGLMVSVGIVFFNDYMKSLKIKDEKDVINLLDIPVLTTIEK